MRKPLAVVIGDIHFTIATLELATTSLVAAHSKAKELGVPLIVNGDILDGKAIVRGEVMNRLIDLARSFKDRILDGDYESIIFNVGNHDLLNEKAKEHSLNFLSSYFRVVNEPVFLVELGAWVIPYQNNSESMLQILKGIEKGSLIFLHQGVMSAFMGDYVQDKTSLPKETFRDYRVIGSHYHRHQSIKCGPPRKGAVGLFTYVGAPYSMSFGEASDGPKGYGVLYDDGILEQIPLDLRRHVVAEFDYQEPYLRPLCRPSDLLWLKIKGPQSELKKLNKKAIGEVVIGHSNFKLDLIPEDSKISHVAATSAKTTEQILDSLIDDTGETDEQKTNLKSMWRELV